MDEDAKPIAELAVCTNKDSDDSASINTTNSSSNSSSTFSPDDGAIPSLRFPQKLWRIVNECRSGAISWGAAGQTIRLNYKSFQDEYLGSGNNVFKTGNIASFIRQLNLYGFRKLTAHNRDNYCPSRADAPERDFHEFLHEYFRAGRLDLLSRVCRKTGAKKASETPKLPVKRKMAEGNRMIGLSKLQMCQIALTKALEQATKQYKQEKFWVQLSNKTMLKNDFKSEFDHEPMNSNIQIIFQGLSDNLPIIDVATKKNIDCEDKNQWQEIFLIPKDNSVSLSVPY